MSVAVTGAFVIGQWPEAAMVMALYAIAELIEARAADRARNAIQGLVALAPEQADVLQADKRLEGRALCRCRAGGDRAHPPRRARAAGRHHHRRPQRRESGPGHRGEPARGQHRGDMVFAGTINETGELQFRVTAAAANTTLARIIHAVEQAQGTRAPTQRLVDRFAAIYTPAVFVLALATAAADAVADGL